MGRLLSMGVLDVGFPGKGVDVPTAVSLLVDFYRVECQRAWKKKTSKSPWSVLNSAAVL
jgi:hypothetical protein